MPASAGPLTIHHVNPRPPRPRRLLVALAGLALAATACGSTVPKAELQAALANGGQNGGLGTGGSTGAATGTTGLGGTGTAGTTGLTTGTTGVTTGTTGLTSGGPLGPGITATTINIGVIHVKNSAAGNAALGVAGTEVDDQTPYRVVLDDINSHGGVAGRKLKTVTAVIDTTSSQTIDQQAQAACATWTQDNKVFAILGGAQGGIVEECAEKAHAINIIPGGASIPDTFRRYPHYLEISGMNLVRMGPVTVKGIGAQGYFNGSPKLGIVTWDEPEYHTALADGYLPALRGFHVTPATPIAYIHAPQTYNDLGGMNSDINSAVLRFSGQDIDHVMIIDGAAGICAGACLGYEFLNQAQSQEYYPRYGFNDYNYADTSVDSLYPHQQLVGSVGVIWSDDDSSHDVGWHTNKARESCYDLMHKHGFDYDATNQNQTYAVRAACEMFWFFRDVIARLPRGATLNNDNFMTSVNQMGTSFQSLNTYVSRLSASQHDGASAVRNEAYFESCKCYKFTSAPYEA